MPVILTELGLQYSLAFADFTKLNNVSAIRTFPGHYTSKQPAPPGTGANAAPAPPAPAPPASTSASSTPAPSSSYGYGGGYNSYQQQQQAAAYQAYYGSYGQPPPPQPPQPGGYPRPPGPPPQSGGGGQSYGGAGGYGQSPYAAYNAAYAQQQQQQQQQPTAAQQQHQNLQKTLQSFAKYDGRKRNYNASAGGGGGEDYGGGGGGFGGGYGQDNKRPRQDGYGGGGYGGGGGFGGRGGYGDRGGYGGDRGGFRGRGGDRGGRGGFGRGRGGDMGGGGFGGRGRGGRGGGFGSRYDNSMDMGFSDPNLINYDNVLTDKRFNFWNLPSKARVLIVSNLSMNVAQPQALFNLFSAYGDVARVKILRNKLNAALVEFSTATMAAIARDHTDGCPVSGKKLVVSFSKFDRVRYSLDWEFHFTDRHFHFFEYFIALYFPNNFPASLNFKFESWCSSLKRNVCQLE